MEVDVDGGVGYPSGVCSWLWMLFSRPRGWEGRAAATGVAMAPPVATVVPVNVREHLMKVTLFDYC